MDSCESEKYVKVVNGDLSEKVYRLLTMSESGDIFGVKVAYGDPLEYVRAKDVIFVSKEVFETANENRLNNAKFGI